MKISLNASKSIPAQILTSTETAQSLIEKYKREVEEVVHLASLDFSRGNIHVGSSNDRPSDSIIVYASVYFEVPDNE